MVMSKKSTPLLVIFLSLNLNQKVILVRLYLANGNGSRLVRWDNIVLSLTQIDHKDYYCDA